MKKWWKPWPASGDATYFEIAIITEDGYRSEFHHMDKKKIAPEVLKLLQAPSSSFKPETLQESFGPPRGDTEKVFRLFASLYLGVPRGIS